MVHRTFLILFLGLLFLSCSDRERNNPLDPQNSVTKGRISGISISSRERSIYLSWQPLAIANVDSILVYRQNVDGYFNHYKSLQKNSSSFVEANTQYGQSYTYYVTAKVGDYESPPSDKVSIVPGPTYLWVGDLANGYFSRFTYDLRSTIFSFGILRYPKLIAVLPKDRSAWCYSLFSDVLYKLDEDGVANMAFYNLGRITDLAADTSYQELWIAQLDSGLIRRIDSSGNIVSSLRIISSPKRIVADSRRHTAWTIDEQSKQVFRISRAGFLVAKNQVALEDPKDIAVEGNTSNIWIADGPRIVNLDYVGESIGTIFTGFSETIFIDFDNNRNSMWVVDKIGNEYLLVKLNKNGERIFQIDQFVKPVAIDINEFDGSCMVADPGKGGVFKVSESGNIVFQLDGYVSPQTIAVEHH